MTANLNQFGSHGLRLAHYALYDSASPSYIAGTDGTLAAGEDSGMGRLLGISDLAAAVPEAPVVSRIGDNGSLGGFLTNPTDQPSGSMAFGSFGQLFDVAITQRAIKAEGPHDISLSSHRCYDFRPFLLVVNSPAESDEAGSLSEPGWEVEEYLYVLAQPMSVAAHAANTPHEYTHRLVFKERDRLPWGELITVGNYGLTRAWKTDPYWSPWPVYYHTYVGDGGAAQTFTLSEIPVADDGTALQIWDNGTKLEHSTNYAVNTSTGVVTFVSTDPASGNFAVCKVLYDPGC